MAALSFLSKPLRSAEGSGHDVNHSISLQSPRPLIHRLGNPRLTDLVPAVSLFLAHKLPCKTLRGSDLQRIGVSRRNEIHTRSHSLRFGAAEEGLSSWEEKLTSTESETGEKKVEGAEHAQSEHVATSSEDWRDRTVDDEGNIDNIEQEQLSSESGDGKMEEEEEALQTDAGKTPDDYHRRADLFGKRNQQLTS